jgi:branched-chain amino acid transport system permease protein
MRSAEASSSSSVPVRTAGGIGGAASSVFYRVQSVLRRPSSQAVLCFGLLVVAIIVPAFWKSYLLTQLILVAAVLDLAIVWNVVAGFAGQLSLVHGSFFGIGAYAVVMEVSLLHGSTWIGVVIGAAVSAVLAVVITALTIRFRIRGIYFALVTLATAVIVQDAISNSTWLGSSVGLNLSLASDAKQLRFATQMPYLWILVVGGGLLFMASGWLKRRSLGPLLMAVRDDEVAYQSLGRSPGLLVSGAMATSAVASALIGSLYALAVLAVSPNATLSLNITFAILVSTIIGGIGTRWGPVVGALIYEGGLVIVSQAPGGTGSLPILVNVGFGVLIVALVVLRPKGLVG